MNYSNFSSSLAAVLRELAKKMKTNVENFGLKSEINK